MEEFVTSFRSFLFSAGWDPELVFASVAGGSFRNLSCLVDRVSFEMPTSDSHLEIPGDEGRPSFEFSLGC